MISEKVKKLVDNMSMSDLKLWIHSSFGNVASPKGKEIKEYMIKNITRSMEIFNANKVKDQLVQGICDWFDRNGKGCKAVIGLSGGKDSTIVAALCAEALGKENVIGVGIPDKGQSLNEADEIAKYLGIEFRVVNIDKITEAIGHSLYYNGSVRLSNQAEQNIPPRVRMLVLYAISQSVNGRVIGTCNASENYIGYFTKYGDGASDFEPIAELTVHELYQIGDALGIPKKWTYKVPDDGLPHSLPDDEKFEKMGFNYEKLDKYIRTGTSGDENADNAIKQMHEMNLFKLQMSETITDLDFSYERLK